MDSMILLVAMIAVFYFLIIRPENKRKKQAEDMRISAEPRTDWIPVISKVMFFRSDKTIIKALPVF